MFIMMYKMNELLGLPFQKKLLLEVLLKEFNHPPPLSLVLSHDGFVIGK